LTRELRSNCDNTTESLIRKIKTAKNPLLSLFPTPFNLVINSQRALSVTLGTASNPPPLRKAYREMSLVVFREMPEEIH